LRSGRGLARRQDTLTATAAAAQPFDESGNGGAGGYRQARQRFSCQQADVTAPQALNLHALLDTHAKHPNSYSSALQIGAGKISTSPFDFRRLCAATHFRIIGWQSRWQSPSPPRHSLCFPSHWRTPFGRTTSAGHKRRPGGASGGVY
jgi:hypothetical protein